MSARASLDRQGSVAVPKALVAFAGLLVLAGCVEQSTQTLQGYVEGESALLSAAASGYLTNLDVKAGDLVTAGQRLFVVDDTLESQALQQSQALAESAKARVENLQQPKRPAEVQAAQAQVQAAQAAEKLSHLQYERQVQLSRSGFVSSASLDVARAGLDRDQAALANAKAQLHALQLALGRELEVQAAKQDAASAQAIVAQARTRRAQKTVLAPVTGQVQDTYYRLGEWVQGGMPVVSVLSPDRIKVRFFIPETSRARYPVGTHVKVTCDACPQAYSATIRFVSNQAEYTPPVIYSRQAREKLVYLVEAWPEEMLVRQALMPGQPVDVSLP